MRSRLAMAVLAPLCGCVFLFPPQARGQSHVTAVGRVVDAQGVPIPDVQVLLEYRGPVAQRYRTKTDKTGKFIHLNVYEGLYRVTLTKEGVGTDSFDFVVEEIPSTQPPPDLRLVAKVVAPPPGSGLAPAGPASAAPVDLGRLVTQANAAGTLLDQGKVDEAVTAYESIAAEAPQVPVVHLKLAEAYKRKGDLAKAEASARRSVELDPKYVDGHVGLATILAASGKREQAIEVLRQAAATNDRSARLQYALGVLEVAENHNAEAKDAFLKAEALEPQNLEVQYQLGTVAMNMNDRPEAIARFEKYVAAAPPDASNVAVAKALIAALQKK